MKAEEWFELAKLSFQKKLYEKASTQLDEALSQERLFAYAQLKIQILEKQNTKLALTLCKKLFPEFKENIEIYLYIAKYYRLQGQHKKALNYYRLAYEKFKEPAILDLIEKTKKQMNRIHLIDLPIEIVAMIFAFFDTSVLLNCLSVSKKWLQVLSQSDYLWQRIYLTKPTGKTVAKVIEFSKNRVQELSLKKCRGFKRLNLGSCQRLMKVVLTNSSLLSAELPENVCHLDFSNSNLCVVLLEKISGLPKLAVFNINNCTVPENYEIKIPAGLKELHCNDVPLDLSGLLLNVLEAKRVVLDESFSMPSLHTLIVNCRVGLVNYRNLRHLTITGHLTDENCECLSECPLEELNCRMSQNLTNRGLEHLALISTLRELDIAYCPKIFRLPEFVCLESLDISYSPIECILVLSKLPLTKLLMDGCRATNSIFHLLSSIPTMKFLSVKRTPVRPGCIWEARERFSNVQIAFQMP